MADAELGVPHRLTNPFLATVHESRQPSSVGSFGGRLSLDLATIVRLIEFFRREQSQLLVCVMELHLAIADFVRLAIPFAHLLGDPDRMLIGTQDIPHVTGRVCARPAGEVVFHEQPYVQRLRFVAQRLRAEGADQFEQLLIGRSRREDLFPGRLKTLTHDYKRNGTTTLFAAIELAHGRIIVKCLPQHRDQEWIRFLKKIDAETPPNLDLHLIVDNYATQKHPNVVKWLKRHRRFHLHFTPTRSSWLNVIERWFRDITQDRIRNGVFRSVAELEQAIRDYIAHHNAHPKTFVWTKKAEDMLAKVARARSALNKIPSE